MNLEDIISWIATILGFSLKASPIVLFYQIAVGNKKIEIVPEMLIICSLVSAELWFNYWIRIGSKMAPIVSSSVSFILSYIFSIIYLYYFSEKKYPKFINYIIIEGIVIALLYIGAFFTKLIITGFIANIVNVLNMVSPGQRIVRVCRERNYSLIPIVTTMLGAITSLGWLIFGIMLMDVNVIIPNTLSVFISSVNSLIWFYFYCTTEEKKEIKEEEDEVEMVETARGDDEEIKEI